MKATDSKFRATSMALGLGLAAMLAFTPLLAQTGGNTGLRGRVIDQSAGAIPGVAVTVTRQDTEQVRTRYDR